MRKLVLAVVFAIIGMGLNAQDNDVVKEEFYSNGSLKAQFVALNDNLIQATYFFESGEIYETGFFENDQLSGKWKTYNVDSQLTTIGFFTENKKTGTWSFYKDGSLEGEISYSQVQMAKK
jgi:antitoxin component YwqK of YwqJK toxin-antitoxin module